MGIDKFGLSPKAFSTAFPFHLIFDRSTNLLQAGTGIRRLVPELSVGDRLSRHFRIQRPTVSWDFVALQDDKRSIFLLGALSNEHLLLKGQMIALDGEDAIAFVGSPWGTKLEDFTEAGISLKDFAVHDTVPDYLFLIQTQTTSLADANRLAEELEEARSNLETHVQERTTQLREANQALQTQIAERKQAEELFRTVAESTSRVVPGTAFFRSLLRNLALALKTQYAFVSERDNVTGRVKVLEIWTGSDFGESMPLEVSGGPCEQVLAGEVAVYPEGVQTRFPGHKTLAELGAESYLGVPLFDSSGGIIGHLAVLDTKAMENSEQGLSVVKVFAARAGAELERKRAEEHQKNIEAKLQQSQKLESLGVLAGGIAHDFNNLLMGVLGHAEIALIELTPESPARGDLKNITTAALRAAELTKQMLAYSGKGKFVVEALNLSKLVEEMAHLLQVSISKNVVLKYNFADNLPTIEADASQIRQVVMNLIINASEAVGEESGVVTVSTSVIEADHSYLSETYLDENLPEGYYVSLEVADTGCGMDEQTQQKIFDPFFTTKFTGRGLGLAAVLGIVRGHGGAMKIYSQPQRGTTFKVLFPASRQPVEESAGPSAPEQEWRGSGVILVVDDEETVRIAAKIMLETRGFTVLTAEDGRAALEVFRSRIDEIVVVLLDLTMPHLDGEETFRELRRMRPDVRVILSSGYSEQETTDRFAGKGLAGFIQKPYGLRPLIEKIRQALEAPESDRT